MTLEELARGKEIQRRIGVIEDMLSYSNQAHLRITQNVTGVGYKDLWGTPEMTIKLVKLLEEEKYELECEFEKLGK